MRDLAGADSAARTGDVLDEEGLTETFAELLRHQARDEVGRAAGDRGR